MLAKFKQMPLERQLFISFVSVSSILLLVTMGIMLYVDITRQLRSMDDTIRSSAAYIAQLEAVEDMLERGYPDPAVSRQLDSLSENVKDLNVIVIYNTSGLRTRRISDDKTYRYIYAFITPTASRAAKPSWKGRRCPSWRAANPISPPDTAPMDLSAGPSTRWKMTRGRSSAL